MNVTLEQFEAHLEGLVPNPVKRRLINVEREYSALELKDLLQVLGSHLATLTTIAGKLEAECHLIKETYKKGMAMAMASQSSTATQVAVREAEVLCGSVPLQQLKDQQIDSEAFYIMTKSWRNAYEDAYNAISRIVTLEIGEISLQTSRNA